MYTQLMGYGGRLSDRRDEKKKKKENTKEEQRKTKNCTEMDDNIT